MRRDLAKGIRQGLWFIGLWALGVGVLGVVALVLRGALKLTGG